MELTVWSPAGEIKGAVLLIHGMAEHIGRYARLAERLNAAGYLAAGYNHRGHGEGSERLGYFADKHGWDCVIDDLHTALQSLRRAHPGVPLILLGHSMGSFAVREAALRFGDEMDALVISGTGFYPYPLCAAGWLLAKCSSPKAPAPLVDKIAFSANNRPFEPARTPFDWLSRDEAEVDRYLADPYCGFVFCGRAFADFFHGLIALTKKERLAALPKALPVYFLSGDCDPVGQMGEGVGKVAAAFTAAGMRDVTVRLYPGARHELFNETTREQVTDELITWLDEKI